MKKRYKWYITILIIFSILCMPLTFHTLDIHAEVFNKNQIYDEADILTSSEEKALSNKLQNESKKHNMDIIICTINSCGSYDLDDYTAIFWDENNFAKDGVILIINMDPSAREILLQKHGKCLEYIPYERAQYITDGMVPEMKAGKYYDGIIECIDKVDLFMNHKAPIPTAKQYVIEIIISLIIATIIVIIMVHNAGGKNTAGCYTYLNSATSKLLAKRDIYTHTTTTRHKIEKSSSSSGKGGGGGSRGSGRSSF